MLPWKYRKNEYMVLAVTISLMLAELSLRCVAALANKNESYVDKELINYVDQIFSVDKLNIMPGFHIESKQNASRQKIHDQKCENSRNLHHDVTDYFYKKWDQYIDNHVLAVNMSETSRFLKQETGKSSFMAGFGIGFLAFALKKLLLPVFIGAQIVKSLLIAMFLPSILGSLGKLLGKGLSSVSGISGSSGSFGGGAQPVEDFEFKDTSPYNNDMENQDFNDDNSISFNTGSSSESPEAMNRFGTDGHYDSYTANSNNYYIRKPSKRTDYKVFHKIPPSSLLLTSYDPFYSPLLSRLDSVFQQLRLGDSKSLETEKCRERLVCMMYANPAKYAPYSNLVSAQLSRELNELRKPTSDNPEILRFFKYMKAAKDGQDGEECLAHVGCPMLSAQDTSPAMLTTFKDINKLVQARKIRNV